MNRFFKSTSAKFTQSCTSRSSQRERASRRTRLEVEALEDRILLSLDCPVGFRDTNEPFIAVNPLDPANVVVSDVNQQLRISQLRISTNGGSSFPTSVAATAVPGFRRGGDDVLAFDGANHLYWTYLEGQLNAAGTADAIPQRARVMVQQVNPTTGALMGAAVNVSGGIANNDDKPWIAVDANPNSPFAGNIYVVWTRLDTGTVEFSRSTTAAGTGAINGFSAPAGISSEATFVWPSHVAVATNGELYVAYHENTGGSNTTADQHIEVIRDTTGGAALQAGLPLGAGTTKTEFNAGVTMNVQSSPATANQVPFVRSWMQGAVQPFILTDPVRPSNVYIAYNSDPDGSFTAGDPGDVFLARSEDNGAHWSSFVPVSHGPGGSLQAYPNASIDQFGNIAVTWYDTRGNTMINPDGVLGDTSQPGGVSDDHYAMNVFASTSTDGGVTFSDDFRVNDLNNSFDPDAGAPVRFGPTRTPPNNGTANTLRIGEYNGIAVANGVAYVVWTGNTFIDSPSGPVAIDQQIFFDTFPLNGSSIPPPFIVGIEGLTRVPTPPAFQGNSSVAWFNGFLYRTGRDVDNHPVIEVSDDDGATWGSRAVLTEEFTLNSPALAADCNTGKLFIAWTGTDKHINVAVVTTAADGDPTGIVRGDPLGYTSDYGPALAFHNGALVLAHAGTPDGNIFLDFMSAAKPHWGADARIGFPGALNTGEISKKPQMLTEFNNRLYLSWTGTDGAANLATVDLIGRTGAALQTFPVVNGTLTIDGDQFGADFNDDVTIERSDSGGVKVTLNGQVVQFAPGAITGIVVNTGGGRNAVRVQATFAEAPVAINGGGTDRLTFLGNPPSTPVYTPDANNFPGDGTVNLGGSPIHFNSLEFVDSVAPTIPAGGLQLGPAVIDENGTVTLSGQFLDPGSDATHRVAVNWGDGVSDAPVGLALGARSFTFTHRYLDDNPTGTPFDVNTITVTVTDNDNLNGTATTPVTVNNVAPRLANVTVTPEIDENGVVSLSGDILETGTQDTFTLLVDWGEGAPQSFSYPAGTTHFSETHQYLDDNPTGTPQDGYAIRLTLTDDDTGQGTAAVATLVRNVAPVFTALGTSSTSAGPAAEGEPVTMSGTFTDVGTLDTHTVTLDWGDGIVTAAAVTEAGGAGSFVAQHTFQFGGIYPVLVTLRDDDTGQVSRLKAVFVTGVGVHEVGGLTSLQVVGSIRPDRVTINQQGNGQVRVHADFLREGMRTLPLAGLDIIQVVLLAGDDRAVIAGNVGLPAVLDGGDGDDFLNGSNAGSVLIGGRGNDVLLGGNRRDILIGGLGADRLVANGGDDILIGGFTAYDSGADDDKLANDLALLRLSAEWGSGRSSAERVANLRDGSGPLLGGTGLRLRKGTTVFDDLEADVLTSSSGVDWFFFDPLKDKRTGRTGGEVTD